MTSLASVQQPACVKFTGTLHIQDQSSLVKQKDKDLLSSTVTDRSAPKSYFFLSDEKKKEHRNVAGRWCLSLRGKSDVLDRNCFHDVSVSSVSLFEGHQLSSN